MKIAIVTPAPVDTPFGNSITAKRWAGILNALGHEVSLSREWIEGDHDLLVALHARRSSASVEKFRRARPNNPLIVALTGTDLYRDLRGNADAHRSVSLATRIVALQNMAGAELDEQSRAKLSVIYQSAVRPASRQPFEVSFEVCVLSHLRAVKDPLRGAFAARNLPADSKIRVAHAGRTMEEGWEERVEAESQTNPRYRWLGEQTHDAALTLLARSRALVLSSEIEGGANVIAEAVACQVPVLCSKIPGNIGMLGPDYPGYFRFRDTDELRALLIRIESEPGFQKELRRHIESLRGRFSPEQEKESWRSLMEQLCTNESMGAAVRRTFSFLG